MKKTVEEMQVERVRDGLSVRMSAQLNGLIDDNIEEILTDMEDLIKLDENGHAKKVVAFKVELEYNGVYDITSDIDFSQKIPKKAKTESMEYDPRQPDMLEEMEKENAKEDAQETGEAGKEEEANW